MADKSLQDKVRESREMDAERLLDAKDAAARLMREHPGEPKHVKAFEAARAALEKHLAAPDAGGSGKGFANHNQVLQWLVREGYQISRSALYGKKHKSKLRPGPDGMISEDTVEAYIAWAELKKIGVPDDDGDDNGYAALSLDRQEVALRRERAQAEREELKLAQDRGELFPREELEGELCARALQHDALLRRMIREEAGDWVHLVEGKPDKTRALQDMLFERVDDVMREFSRMDVMQVIILPKAAADA